jgi:hypothetical protein
MGRVAPMETPMRRGRRDADSRSSSRALNTDGIFSQNAVVALEEASCPPGKPGKSSAKVGKHIGSVDL